MNIVWSDCQLVVDVYPFPCGWGWELETTGSYQGLGCIDCPVHKCNFIISVKFYFLFEYIWPFPAPKTTPSSFFFFFFYFRMAVLCLQTAVVCHAQSRTRQWYWVGILQALFLSWIRNLPVIEILTRIILEFALNGVGEAYFSAFEVCILK